VADGGLDVEGDPDRLRASVVVGPYRLDVGSPAGSSISPIPTEPAQSAEQAALCRAVSDRAPERKKQAGAVEAVDVASDDAEQVTDQVDRGLKLWTSVAAGRLDVSAVNDEIDTLLALLQRLDREGRFEEQLRLARASSRLLAVALRWVDLLRSLRDLLAAAERHSDAHAKAWALHELGTLHLAAGKHVRAEKMLGDARELRAQLGDKRALAVTDHNLQTLCRVLRQLMRDGELRERRHLRQLLRAHAVVLAAVVLLTLGGGTAAIAAGGLLNGGHSRTASTAAKRRPTGTSTSTTGPVGTKPPVGASIAPSSLDFGNQAVGTPGTAKTVRLSNTGKGPLTVSSVDIIGANHGDFMKSSDTCGNQTVQAGGSCPVQVTFTPSAAGTRTATLSFADNAPSQPQQAALSGTGSTAAVADVSPLAVAFTASDTGPKTVTLTNKGNGPLTVSSVDISGANSGEFAKSSDGCGNQTVPPQGTCSVDVKFTPSAPGTRTATLSFADNASGSPQQVSLSGPGLIA
jgi:hypothetical protein